MRRTASVLSYRRRKRLHWQDACCMKSCRKSLHGESATCVAADDVTRLACLVEHDKPQQRYYSKARAAVKRCKGGREKAALEAASPRQASSAGRICEYLKRRGFMAFVVKYNEYHAEQAESIEIKISLMPQ